MFRFKTTVPPGGMHTVDDGVLSHPRGPVFQARLLDNQEGASANTEPYVFGKLFNEMFPPPTSLAPALFQLWRYQPWIIGPGGCESVMYTVRGKRLRTRNNLLLGYFRADADFRSRGVRQ